MPLLADISAVHSMQEVASCCEQADEKTLVIFDIDMVLVQPSEPAFQMTNMRHHKAILKKMLQELGEEENRTHVWVLSAISCESMLVDAKTPHLLMLLKERKIPTIALTANLTGPFAHVPRLENEKINRLKTLGIDFSHCFAQDFIFEDLPTYRNHSTVFTNGILFTNAPTVTKGQALLAFLKKTSFMPKKVIFVDDRLDNVKSVEEALRGQNIPCDGLHFLGTNDSPVLDEKEFVRRWQDLIQRVEILNLVKTS